MAQYDVYVWLVAKEDNAVSQQLQRLINSGSGPSFCPHITLAAFKSSEDTEKLVDKLRALSLSFSQGDLSVSFDAPAIGSSYHFSIFLPVVGESKRTLNLMRDSTLKHFGMDSSVDSYVPHLSLFYGDANTRDNNKHLLSEAAVVKQLELSSLQLIISKGKEPSLWQPLARSPLGRDWIFRDSMWIDGQWCSGEKGEKLSVYNPATGKVFHSVPNASATDIDLAVKAATRAFSSWRKTSVSARARLLNALADAIISRRKLLSELETLDNGKSREEADADIGDAADCFKYYAKLIVDREQADNCTDIDVGNSSFKCYVRREPIGVVGHVIPWNYPLLMAAWKLAPSLAAGCTVVLKPSELTPLSILELAALSHTVGFPPGVLNICTGYGPSAGAPLVSHPNVAKVAFTGSVATGKAIMKQCSELIKNCTLELGVVFEDADLDQVTDWVTVGIFFNSGQSIKDKALEKLAKVAGDIKVGFGLDEGVKMGPIISQAQYEKVTGYIQSGVDEGATLVTGGPIKGSNGYFIRPTIFADVKPEMKIWKEEIFGPVLSVMTFKTEEEAIKLANDTNYGLAAAVVSKDQTRAERVAHEFQAVWINCSQPTFVQAPWGGYKESGIGRELGHWGLENYLETKQVSRWVDTKATGWQWFTASQ